MEKASKKKLIIILLVVILAIGLGGGGYFAVTAIIEANKQLVTPVNLKVICLPDGKKYVSVDRVTGALNYEFVITPTGESAKTIVRATNATEISSDYLTKQTTYIIKCRALGAEERNHSEYCNPISYENKLKLKTPQINLTGNKLEVSLAETYSSNITIIPVLTYTYGSDIFTTSQHFTLSSSENSGTFRGYFDLTFLEPHNQYSLSVKLTANNPFYLESDLTQQQIFNFA